LPTTDPRHCGQRWSDTELPLEVSNVLAITVRPFIRTPLPPAQDDANHGDGSLNEAAPADGRLTRPKGLIELGSSVTTII
jgi:hypothetical protein